MYINRSINNKILKIIIPKESLEELVGHAVGGVCPFVVNKGVAGSGIFASVIVIVLVFAMLLPMLVYIL